jgi:hypothetical protein
VALHSKNPNARERILSFGGAGQGKSYDFYTIVQLAQMTKSDAKFYVIDTDVSAYRMLEDPSLDRLTDGDGNLIPNLVIEDEVWDWETLMGTLKRVQSQMKPNDWLMLDMLSPAWGWVQTAFTEKVFGQGTDEYFLQKRAAMKNPAKEKSFEGWTDWPVINAMYKSFQSALLRSPGHLYATAEVRAISSDSAEKDTRMFFGPYGVIPVGQKRDMHLFQTVILKASTKIDRYEAITVKDRGGREKMAGMPIENFAKNYLMKIGGWKLA